MTDGHPADAPIRAELFSVARLERHAESLAVAQGVLASRGNARRDAARLSDNAKVLTEAYGAVVRATCLRRPITPAAEWLLDNFHVVDEQIREIKDNLPSGFYQTLPKLADGPMAGSPRVFGLAWALVAHTDSGFDRLKLTRFVEAYQRVQPLDIGELWAIAITLRITLVENLRRLMKAVVSRMAARDTADAIADLINGLDHADAAAIRRKLAEAKWSDSFALQLMERLRDHDPDSSAALQWLRKRLVAEGVTADELVLREVRHQSATMVTVRNVITSMRLVSSIDWAEWFEDVSIVDAMLRDASDFAAMDFTTRDRYRREIETFGRRSGRSEIEVARKAIAAANEARALAARDNRQVGAAGDPGYYLISKGRHDFERALQCRPSIRQRLASIDGDLAVRLYAFLIALVTGCVLALGVAAAAHSGLPADMTTGIIAMLAVVGAVPASDLAVALINRIIARNVGSRSLPAMGLRSGVPADLATFVVIPTLLTGPGAIAKDVRRLEVHYLANTDDHLHFALLTDWADAPCEHAADDDKLLAEAATGIARLNRLHGRANGTDRFFLLHRRRSWNAGEGKWIGWERKRGKLHELNRLLRGATDTSFLDVHHGVHVDNDVHQGAPLSAGGLPTNIRFVITLDADTRMPIDVARRLIAKMAHPLNRPRFDEAFGCVVEGYGILQPRVTPSLPIGQAGSLFQRAFSGPNGLDPYAFAVSDVYQDLFDEGSYVGKGIYDIDAVEHAMRGRIPENMVLSHDLLEGIYTRAGLTSDVEVVEEFPSRYDVAAARQHRWTRGDWQLLPWILGPGPGFRRPGCASGISVLDRWKLLENLRRSLSAPATLLGFIAGWLLPLDAALTWTTFLVLTIALPSLLPAIMATVPRSRGMWLHFKDIGQDLAFGLLQAAFLLTFLAHQAWMMVDAIFRTLYRQFVTRQKLLEWTTAAQSVEDGQFDTRSLWMQEAASLGFAAIIGVVIAKAGAGAWPVALPLAVLWVLSPLVARWANRRPLLAGEVSVRAADAAALRLIGRRTWCYFEKFLTPEDHWLPPDNFQETPLPVVARRTSPTNIGLYLLSCAAAYDLGWHGTLDMLDRLDATLATLDRLERMRGHFYNWYDTNDLRVLEPRYVSSVDSGNLAGYLITLGNACLDIAASGPRNGQWVAGLDDGLRLAIEAVSLAPPGTPTAGLTNALSAFRKTLHGTADLDTLVLQADTIASMAGPDEFVFWAQALRTCARSHQRDTRPGAELEDVATRLASLAGRFKAMAIGMDFTFVFDNNRQLLSIGRNEANTGLDPNDYDLLASEARLASFIAIAKGDLPALHWFRLGRTLTTVTHQACLMSWSGSMFEYLLPSLVMRAPAGSMLEQTRRLSVRRQISYGTERDVPWGMSESLYNTRDAEQTYQYSSFGVPDLGFKRTLGESTVVAPYATALAAMVNPAAAVRNFKRLTALGMSGPYGWYESIDFTPARLPAGANSAVIRAYMSHHHGMGLVAIANVLCAGIMRARFHNEPMVEAAELLLQERTPRDAVMASPPPDRTSEALPAATLVPDPGRHYAGPCGSSPRTLLLSNGRTTVMVTATGAGYTRWGDVAVSRWREDPTCDPWGGRIFLRDIGSGQIWQAGHPSSGPEPDSSSVMFFEDRAEFTRTDGAIDTRLEVMVSPEDDAEIRRVSITNHGTVARDIELTSCMELALARQPDDLAHPAFAKLFIKTEFVPEIGALLAMRRRRSDADPEIWAAHLVIVEGDSIGGVQFETDRARFVGRGRSARNPVAMRDGWPLSNTAGPVLDPLFSLRRRVRVPKGGTVRLTFWTMTAATRASLLDLVDRHGDEKAFERAAALAWTQAQLQLRHDAISFDTAHLFQRLAGHVLYANPTLRPASDALIRGAGTAATLWPLGISGDLPIVLVSIATDDGLDLVGQLLAAHAYLRLKQLTVDLVILNEASAPHAVVLQAALEKLVRIHHAMRSAASSADRGAIFVLRGDLIAAEPRALLRTAARVLLASDHGSLAEHLDRADTAAPPTASPDWVSTPSTPTEPSPPRALEFFNGLGGFARDGREYVTVLGETDRTPAPWINVIANPSFGFQVSTDGGGTTWAENSQQNQLTPWSNDPVGDAPGEVLYLRDEDTGVVWSATPSPIRVPGSRTVVTHGQGYSRFTLEAHGIALELLQFVATADPIKISRLTITNRSGQKRRLSVTSYVEWVLGGSRTATAPFVITEICPQTGAMLASNPWNGQFGTRIAFADLAGRQTSWTGDRTEFLGRDGNIERPAGLHPGATLSNCVGAGLDPCAALQTIVTLDPAATTELVFLLGQTQDHATARALLTKYRAADLDAVLSAVTTQWDDIAGTIQITTPDRALDIMINRWLPYQTLSCRVWARTAFYQASGAFGFRDQLQDVMALCLSRPDLTRAHLLLAASRQFAEGDVQHWWLPETGNGIRTRIADDRIWLAYVTAHYVAVTGDHAVLDEAVSFVAGPVLRNGQLDAFFAPETASHKASLFEHCALALDTSLPTGMHGLPLMGTGDWNDGMDRVGRGGLGESVWLGWFLYTTLAAFAPIAETCSAPQRATSWRAHMAALKTALAEQAWDGDWYRRAFFDDGTPLGSARNLECRIDAIAQSWSVISGASDPERAAQAMAAVDLILIDQENRLALLFTPPFVQAEPDPGYIKGYPAGIRENGGQYTHAATWSAQAFAMLGDGCRAHAVLSMLNPITHSDSAASMQRYKVEPYVISADVYSMPPHVGRGGWTWYTGSAGWVYRVTLEHLLGFRLQGETLLLNPCIPKLWPGFKISFRHRTTHYEIAVSNPNAVCRGITSIHLDGQLQDGATEGLALTDDGETHQVTIVMG